MSEEIEADDAVLGSLTSILADQAFALDRVFTRAVKDAARSDVRTHRDMRVALKAQALCRATFKILLTLQAVASRRAELSAVARRTKAEARPLREIGAQKNLRIRTNKLLIAGNSHYDQALGKDLPCGQ